MSAGQRWDGVELRSVGFYCNEGSGTALLGLSQTVVGPALGSRGSGGSKEISPCPGLPITGHLAPANSVTRGNSTLKYEHEVDVRSKYYIL